MSKHKNMHTAIASATRTKLTHTISYHTTSRNKICLPFLSHLSYHTTSRHKKWVRLGKRMHTFPIKSIQAQYMHTNHILSHHVQARIMHMTIADCKVYTTYTHVYTHRHNLHMCAAHPQFSASHHAHTSGWVDIQEGANVKVVGQSSTEAHHTNHGLAGFHLKTGNETGNWHSYEPFGAKSLWLREQCKIVATCKQQ
jgi:hypothetical protein